MSHTQTEDGIAIPEIAPDPWAGMKHAGKKFFCLSLALHALGLALVWLWGTLPVNAASPGPPGAIVLRLVGPPGGSRAGSGGDGETGAPARPFPETPPAGQESPLPARAESMDEPEAPRPAKDESAKAEATPEPEAPQPAPQPERAVAIAARKASAPEPIQPRERPPASPQTSSQPQKRAATPSGTRPGAPPRGKEEVPAATGKGAGPSAPGQAPGTSSGPGTNAGSGHASGTGSASGANGADGYLRGNYEYIKKRVRRYLVYSPQAKRMGIQGTVTVAFTILMDGQARDIEVRSSSGHDALDESALEAVRNASPFAPPPEKARVVMPILFSLK